MDTSTIRAFGSDVVLDPDTINGLGVTSAAACQHLRGVSSRRILRVRGNVGSVALNQIRETLALILDLS